MAEINDIAVKGVKPWRGMEYTGFSGNIYMGGKKIGTVVDDGDGGGMNVDIEPKFVDEFNARTEAYLKTLSPEMIKLMTGSEDEVLISDVMELAEIEKEFKKQMKGYETKPVCFVAIFNEQIKDFNDSTFDGMWFMTVIGNEEKRAQELRETKKWRIDTLRIFKTINDFKITA
jgi:hypothetical protein